jgi:SH3 domain-containing protein
MAKVKTTAVLLIVLCLTGAIAFAGGEKMMSVQVRDGQVRAMPSFLGKLVGTVTYGDRVAVIEEKGAWSRIKLQEGALEGWMHTSALSEKKIVLKAGASDVEQAASTEEIALAGKGFNEEVEEEYKAKNPQLDFTWIDRMETFAVSQKQMKKFLKNGDLSPEGGY